MARTGRKLSTDDVHTVLKRTKQGASQREVAEELEAVALRREGFTHQDIAERLQVGATTVGRWLNKAKNPK